MEHDCRSVANKIIAPRLESNNPITHLQVQKLVYFCHAWMLGLYHEPMLLQPIQAWRYGPVLPELYESLRRYGREPIRRPIDLPSIRVEENEYDDRQESIIRQVLDVYGHLSGVQLSTITHAKGTPWHQVWSASKRSVIISDNVIEDYYAQQAAKG